MELNNDKNVFKVTFLKEETDSCGCFTELKRRKKDFDKKIQTNRKKRNK